MSRCLRLNGCRIMGWDERPAVNYKNHRFPPQIIARVRLLKKQGLTPKRIVTDKLRSYGAARREVMPAVEHRSHKGLN
ncbi:hypothetical protein GR243_39775, partial [Rhizobium leguminosarum]|nr:hypothetical protein [Rhizobium leguminosarum]